MIIASVASSADISFYSDGWTVIVRFPAFGSKNYLNFFAFDTVGIITLLVWDHVML